MHIYICFIRSYRPVCWIKSRRRDFQWKLLSFHTERLRPNSFGEMCFLEESYEKMQKNSNFENFESTFYSKSGSRPMPLIQKFCNFLLSRIMPYHTFKRYIMYNNYNND